MSASTRNVRPTSPGNASRPSPDFSLRLPAGIATWPARTVVCLAGQPQGTPMRLAIIGQQAFGKSVLEAFLTRGATVAGVFCAPEKPGAKPDPLRTAAGERAVQV